MKTKEIGIERIEKEAPYFLVNEDKIQWQNTFSPKPLRIKEIIQPPLPPVS